MSRPCRIAAVAWVATLAVVATGYAAPAGNGSHAVVGTLRKLEGPYLVIQTKTGTESIMLVSSSRIHRGARTIPPTSLASYIGQRIKVRYIDHNRVKDAQTVTLSSMPMGGQAKE